MGEPRLAGADHYFRSGLTNNPNPLFLERADTGRYSWPSIVAPNTLPKVWRDSDGWRVSSIAAKRIRQAVQRSAARFRAGPHAPGIEPAGGTSSLPAANLKELIALAKANPGGFSYGAGSQPHLVMEMLKRKAGIDTLHVPHMGLQPAVTKHRSAYAARIRFKFRSQRKCS